MAPVARLCLAAAVAGLAGCAAAKNLPTAQTVAGLAPSGTVTLHQTTVAGFTEGSGTFSLPDGPHRFEVVGTVLGPGGASEITATGEVYRLAKLADFAGRYTEGTGAAGFETGGSENLWLQNEAGVIMHLRGQSEGMTLSLGRQVILIRLSQP